jgi:hypothetical protein
MIGADDGRATMAMRILGLLLFVGLAACSTGEKADVKLLDETLHQYASVMRWSDSMEAGVEFIDPEVLAARPPKAIDLERMRQLQVAGYREQPYAFIDDLRVRQIVQIELVNRHTQEVRSVVDLQEWRFDPVGKRWWLMTGLPRLDPAR